MSRISTGIELSEKVAGREKIRNRAMSRETTFFIVKNTPLERFRKRPVFLLYHTLVKK